MTNKYHVKSKSFISDQLTAVSLYMRVRDHFSYACLLESNDFQSAENSHSIIGFDPLISVKVHNGKMEVKQGDTTMMHLLTASGDVYRHMNALMNSIDIDGENHPYNGFYGHSSFEAVQYFETITFEEEEDRTAIPEMHYFFYRYLIVLDHFSDSAVLIEHNVPSAESRLEEIYHFINKKPYSNYPFEIIGEEGANMTDDDFKQMVTKAKDHCQMGDVFQMVPSRRFSQQYKGDDFQLYRVLRSVNPSPYLYYFDFGRYHIFGSSPESQLVIQDNMAVVNPIAGTFKRTGDDNFDRKEAVRLSEDPKEVAEHTMLVDLARNDLGRHCTHVEVSHLKEIQFYSHVIHLVSRVQGRLATNQDGIQVFGDTFPAGTLSGAPKYRALQLINEYEPHRRGFYGGGIGFFGLNGSVHHAIVIRSFLSLNSTLYYQAGAGIVRDSVEENELQEVNNKLGALRMAIKRATKINDLKN